MYKPPSYYSSGANIHHFSLIPSTSCSTSPPTHPPTGPPTPQGEGVPYRGGGTQNLEHIGMSETVSDSASGWGSLEKVMIF